MAFVANHQPILAKQNRRFDGLAVPEVLVRSVHKSDEPIIRNSTLFEGRSTWHIGFFCEKPNILRIESRGIASGGTFAHFIRALKESGWNFDLSGGFLQLYFYV